MIRRSILTRREALAWAAAFAVIATIICTTHFTSDDPDSELYAGLSARLAQEPASQWVAPQWWGFWERIGVEGPFLEHPAGTFLLPAAVARLGVPAEQSAYVVGIAINIAVVLLIAILVRDVTSRDDARAAMALIQLMPVAFIFRLRANQEYPLLAALLITLVGIDRVRESWGWLTLVAFGLAAGLWIKGAFVIMLLLAAGVWAVINPTRRPGTIGRPIVALAVGVASIGGAMWLYDTWHHAATGLPFWSRYWQRQMSEVTVATPLNNLIEFATHLGFYLSRILWHPAPWSVALLVFLWRHRGSARSWLTARGSTASRGLLFAVAYAALLMLMMSPASRVAERYIFPATHAIAAAGAVIAWRWWPRIRAFIAWLDSRVPVWPATLWLALMLLRLIVGPYLPRIQWN